MEWSGVGGTSITAAASSTTLSRANPSMTVEGEGGTARVSRKQQDYRGNRNKALPEESIQQAAASSLKHTRQLGSQPYGQPHSIARACNTILRPLLSCYDRSGTSKHFPVFSLIAVSSDPFD